MNANTQQHRLAVRDQKPALSVPPLRSFHPLKSSIHRWHGALNRTQKSADQINVSPDEMIREIAFVSTIDCRCCGKGLAFHNRAR
jgi:hypothetical protein